MGKSGKRLVSLGTLDTICSLALALTGVPSWESSRECGGWGEKGESSYLSLFLQWLLEGPQTITVFLTSVPLLTHSTIWNLLQGG